MTANKSYISKHLIDKQGNGKKKLGSIAGNLITQPNYAELVSLEWGIKVYNIVSCKFVMTINN